MEGPALLQRRGTQHRRRRRASCGECCLSPAWTRRPRRPSPTDLAGRPRRRHRGTGSLSPACAVPLGRGRARSSRAAQTRTAPGARPLSKARLARVSSRPAWGLLVRGSGPAWHTCVREVHVRQRFDLLARRAALCAHSATLRARGGAHAVPKGSNALAPARARAPRPSGARPWLAGRMRPPRHSGPRCSQDP